MSSITCTPSTSTEPPTTLGAADISTTRKPNQQRKHSERREMLSKHRDSGRAKEMFLKRPSELRSRRTPKGTIIRLSELDQKEAEQGMEDESISIRTAEESAMTSEELAGSTAVILNSDSSLKAIEVPLLSLVINKRRGKSKGRPAHA